MALSCRSYSLIPRLTWLTIWTLFVLISCSNGRLTDSEMTPDNDSSLQVIVEEKPTVVETWKAPDSSSLVQNEESNLILYGRDIVAHTSFYFGPKGSVNHAANGMNCQNCHLKAGTKLYANSYSAVYSIYPKFRARSGMVENLEKRVNDCMERSMNGVKLDSASKEMRAMVAYINWVGKDVQKGVIPTGASTVELPWLDREADIVNGEAAYQKHCISCHGVNGEGMFNPDSVSYLYPPLWGNNSYNSAAGMYRLARLASFIKCNMPDKLSSYEKPVLTDEEAWDIAAFVNSMPRPKKTFTKDWPDIAKKPVDYPYGPYADHFDERQHKYGPFKEIVASSTK